MVQSLKRYGRRNNRFKNACYLLSRGIRRWQTVFIYWVRFRPPSRNLLFNPLGVVMAGLNLLSLFKCWFHIKSKLVCPGLIFSHLGFNEQLQIIGYISRSWPLGLVLFLQQKRTKMPPLRLMLWRFLLRPGQSLPHQLPMDIGTEERLLMGAASVAYNENIGVN